MTDRQFEPKLLHEFKNQLSVIYSFSELLLTRLPDGELRKDINEIHKASTAAFALIPKLAQHYHE
jgi:hypothetical protein